MKAGKSVSRGNRTQDHQYAETQYQLVHPIVTVSPPNCDSEPPLSIVSGSKQHVDVRGWTKRTWTLYLRTVRETQKCQQKVHSSYKSNSETFAIQFYKEYLRMQVSNAEVIATKINTSQEIYCKDIFCRIFAP